MLFVYTCFIIKLTIQKKEKEEKTKKTKQYKKINSFNVKKNNEYLF